MKWCRLRLFEAAFADEFRSARHLKAAQGSSAKRDQVIGGLFFAALLLVLFFAPFKERHYLLKKGYKGKLSIVSSIVC